MISRRRFAVASLAALGLSLAACQGEEPADPADEAVTQAGPDATPGQGVTGARLMLPVIAGSPGAAYFILTNGSDEAETLAGVHVEGAESAELHETSGGAMAKLTSLEIDPGENLEFARGGKHVMVFGLSEELKAGGTTEMTLTFADGDKVSVPIKIESMADTAATMDHAAGGDDH